MSVPKELRQCEAVTWHAKPLAVPVHNGASVWVHRRSHALARWPFGA